MNRYKEDTVITVNDFQACNLERWLAGVERGYHAMYRALADAAQKASDNGEHEQGKALWLISDACSMMLSSKEDNCPFKPMLEMGDGRRSRTPDDFSELEIDFFSEIVDYINNIWIKARIADTVWTVDRKKGIKFPRLAIDSYMAMPLEKETWHRDVRDCWDRAVRLSKMIGQGGAGDRLSKMESLIVDSLLMKDHTFAFSLAEILKDNGLGKTHSVFIAERLKHFGEMFEEKGSYHVACDHFQKAFDWLKPVGDDGKSDAMAIRLSECWVKNAKSQRQQMVASAFYQHAIKAYEEVPGSRRENYKVEERMEEIRIEADKSSEKSLTEMGVIETDPIDITHIVKSAQDAVRGKDKNDSILHFVNLYDCNIDELQKDTIEQLEQFPLQGIISASTVNRRGHITGMRSGINLGESRDSESNRDAIEAKMIETFSSQIDFSVNSLIVPAHDVLKMEHRLGERFFIDLVEKSPIVPKNRRSCFYKGLYYGYNNDFGTAIHILAPQIEHMVRYFLIMNGVQTTHFSDGVQHESGLSALIDKPEAKDILGDDLHFQIKALFCHQFGPNLRNVIAHGLLNDDGYNSSYNVYAWWFVFKIVFNTYFNSFHLSEEEK